MTSVELSLLWVLLVLAVFKLAVLLFVIVRLVLVLGEQTRILQGIATQMAVEDARRQASPNE